MDKVVSLVRTLLRFLLRARDVIEGGVWAMRWKRTWIMGLLAASPLGGQERVIEEADLPRHVADAIVAFFNAPETVRFRGRAEVPGGRSIVGDVAVLGGPLLLNGEILGDVVVVNGDMILGDGARLSGDATVIGGEVLGETGVVEGNLVVFSERLPYERQGDRIAYVEGRSSTRDDSSPHSYISVRGEGNYNRVEGLPVMVGPVFSTGGPSRFRADAMAVWRSENGFSLNDEDLGYYARVEQHFGPGGRFSLGATAYSLIEPVERWALADIEASLATFLFHRDYRDYFDRTGFGAAARYHDADAGLSLSVEYRDEDHAYAPVGSPWTLRRNDAPWRPQPLVAEGNLKSGTAEVIFDGRNDPEDPSDGWYLKARATMGLDGSLTLPQFSEPEPSPPTVVSDARALDPELRTGFLDLRRYARLGPGAALKVRGLLGGSLDGAPLPPQFQHALGGEGSLPGYRLMSVDCGARANRFSVLRQVGDQTVREPVFAGYGCDRIAMFQVEYRGDLSFNMDFGPDEWDEDWDWYPVIDFTPRWSVFFDAGRGWNLAEVDDPAWLGPDSETMADVGFGLFFGELGLYWAWPLRGEDRGVNFFVRLEHRF
jgi:hypothetical protein